MLQTCFLAGKNCTSHTVLRMKAFQRIQRGRITFLSCISNINRTCDRTWKLCIKKYFKKKKIVSKTPGLNAVLNGCNIYKVMIISNSVRDFVKFIAFQTFSLHILYSIGLTEFNHYHHLDFEFKLYYFYYRNTWLEIQCFGHTGKTWYPEAFSLGIVIPEQQVAITIRTAEHQDSVLEYVYWVEII